MHPFNISPTLSTLIQPLSPLCLTLPLSLCVFLSQCQWQGLLHEQTASMLCANFSQLWGCGEQLFISGKQTRPITSSGGWCGQGGQRTGGDQQVFFPLLLLFQSQSHPKHLCARTHAHTHTPTQACWDTHAGYLVPPLLQSNKLWSFVMCALTNIPTQMPEGNDAGSVKIPLSLFPLFFPSLATIAIWEAADLYDIFAEENSKSVSFHSCSVIHLPKIGTPSLKIIDMYLCSGWL